MTFPKLKEGGGYELLKCLPNSRSLEQLQVPNGGHSPESLRRPVGRARIYIRPLQRDLPLDTHSQVSSNSENEVGTTLFVGHITARRLTYPV